MLPAASASTAPTRQLCSACAACARHSRRCSCCRGCSAVSARSVSCAVSPSSVCAYRTTELTAQIQCSPSSSRCSRCWRAVALPNRAVLSHALLTAQLRLAGPGQLDAALQRRRSWRLSAERPHRPLRSITLNARLAARPASGHLLPLPCARTVRRGLAFLGVRCQWRGGDRVGSLCVLRAGDGGVCLPSASSCAGRLGIVIALMHRLTR